MATVNIKVTFQAEVAKVWEVVTDLTNYQWRSDLRKIEVSEDGKSFVEYSKDGFATAFTITAFEPQKRYEFDMENQNMKGHWIGLFQEIPEGTEIDFTEDVTAKKALMKPFVGAYLKKQQKLYTEDLREALK
ncbi:Polyketide cyclase / dehydrase and lipid transport [uncultured Eubacterium sp.]|nr:Polyketide cyclase / dehydrase and lipid transport [uncultured Eubacterium sp.]